ncbi:MAG TPA: hypothetical protein VGP47_10380 [Parachlamydiaceae bacterium]|nr:hypothetical protein [Parachlamydiaceae bacterium]
MSTSNKAVQSHTHSKKQAVGVTPFLQDLPLIYPAHPAHPVHPVLHFFLLFSFV